MGPRSRELLQSLTDADLGDEAFPFATSRVIPLGFATLRATRMTYVGELGWELMVPVELATGTYDLLRAGGATDAGYYTIESLRLEKGYRAFGRELTPDFTPVEAGLVFATGLDKLDERDEPMSFLGRDALTAHRERLRANGTTRRRLVSFVVDSVEPMLWGGELVLHDGSPVGQVTSAAWGETVGACVGLAYLRRDEPVTSDWLEAGGFQVDVGGDRFGVRPSLGAPLR